MRRPVGWGSGRCPPAGLTGTHPCVRVHACVFVHTCVFVHVCVRVSASTAGSPSAPHKGFLCPPPTPRGCRPSSLASWVFFED